MDRHYAGILLVICAISSSGCQCFRVTHWYASGIDTVSDYKLELDRYYVPGLDVSRTGMPDWQEFGLNRSLCPCADGVCRRTQRPVYYPAEYRMKFWAMQAESAAAAEIGAEDFMPESESHELTPAPLEVGAGH